jgi:acetyl-CoA carboxylase biotin carboxyl carrier protein
MINVKSMELAIAKLAEMLREHNLDEIECQCRSCKIRLVASRPKTKVDESQSDCAKNGNSNIPEQDNVDPQSNYINHQGAFVSPMVGTCYLSPEPGAPQFVSVGDTVQKDQPILIVEAMKVMNIMKAPKYGKVIHIAVSNATPVEFGQLLLVIE